MKGESAKYVLLFQKNALNHTISNLRENREYLVSVTVYTKLGDAKTENKRVKTKRHSECFSPSFWFPFARHYTFL